MRRLVARAAPAVALLLGLAACDDPAIPTGTAGDVTVRAYVDTDGVGQYSPGDPVISGATVTLQPATDGLALTATTDEQGLARFTAVAPGSYVASLEGNIPAGAAASGPERPVVVVPFRGGTIDVELRYVFYPGSLAGVVFRDDDGTGGYNPDTDLTAAGATLLVYRGSEITGEPVATAVTGSDGAFQVGPLRAGTHAVLVRVPPPLEVLGDSVHIVDVPADGVAELWPQFEGDLFIPIADARAAAAGTTVTVSGTVLADQGVYQFQGRDTYIQDSSAGIRLWDLDPALGLTAGDSVEVVGVVGANNDELQITVSEIEVVGTGAVPAARTVTGADVNSFEYDGQLASTGPVTVTAVQVFSFDAHNVTVEDVEGTSFIVRMESPNEIPSSYWEVGATYRVRGVLARFRDDGQIKPRGFEDVTEVTAGDIADVRATDDGTQVLFEGVVLADQGTYDFGDRDTYVQDATAGIRLWALPTDLGLEAGDSVQVWGSTSTFNDERQVDVAGIRVLGTGTIPDPRPVTAAEINSFEYDGQLGVVGPVTVVSVQVFGFDAHNVTVEDGDGVRTIVRVDSPNEIPSSYWQVGEAYRVTGVMARFRTDGQIKPRGFDDVEEL